MKKKKKVWICNSSHILIGVLVQQFPLFEAPLTEMVFPICNSPFAACLVLITFPEEQYDPLCSSLKQGSNRVLLAGVWRLMTIISYIYVYLIPMLSPASPDLVTEEQSILQNR